MTEVANDHDEFDPLSSLRWHAIVGSVAVFLLVGGVGGWAATTDIAGALIAQGSVVVESDVRCGLLAERRVGAARDLDSAVFVSWGTGLSSAVLVGGYHGAWVPARWSRARTRTRRPSCPRAGSRGAQSRTCPPARR